LLLPQLISHVLRCNFFDPSLDDGQIIQLTQFRRSGNARNL
jgi:hypothetical protein